MLTIYFLCLYRLQGLERHVVQVKEEVDRLERKMSPEKLEVAVHSREEHSCSQRDTGKTPPSAEHEVQEKKKELSDCSRDLSSEEISGLGKDMKMSPPKSDSGSQKEENYEDDFEDEVEEDTDASIEESIKESLSEGEVSNNASVLESGTALFLKKMSRVRISSTLVFVFQLAKS